MENVRLLRNHTDAPRDIIIFMDGTFVMLQLALPTVTIQKEIRIYVVHQVFMMTAWVNVFLALSPVMPNIP